MTDAALIETLDAAMALADDWQPNRTWPKHARTVMLTMREARLLRDRLQAKAPETDGPLSFATMSMNRRAPETGE